MRPCDSYSFQKIPRISFREQIFALPCSINHPNHISYLLDAIASARMSILRPVHTNACCVEYPRCACCIGQVHCRKTAGIIFRRARQKGKAMRIGQSKAASLGVKSSFSNVCLVVLCCFLALQMHLEVMIFFFFLFAPSVLFTPDRIGCECVSVPTRACGLGHIFQCSSDSYAVHMEYFFGICFHTFHQLFLK